MQQSVVTDGGERLIPGSRRPDGTIRKERRIRPGYVPQEEQEVYQSVGSLFRQEVPKCPGMDENEVEAAKQGAKTKAQKKNEKRKAKRTDDKGGDADTISVATSLKNISLGGNSKTEATGSTSTPQPADAEQDPKALLDKQIRALTKKLRQCDALSERKKSGQTLSAPEQEKLGKAPAWQQELDGLEAQLQVLS